MKTHEYCELFPGMHRTDFEKLTNDIRQHGLRHPLVSYKGKLLDGYHRSIACRNLSITPEYTEFKGTKEAALAYVISVNMLRRQMTKPQRATVAAKITNLKHGQTKKSKSGSGPTLKEAAKEMEVDEKTVRQAKKVLDDGDPVLQDAVDDGDISIKDGAELSKLPKEEQREIAENPEPKKAAKKALAKRLPGLTKDTSKSALKIIDYSEDYARELAQQINDHLEES